MRRARRVFVLLGMLAGAFLMGVPRSAVAQERDSTVTRKCNPWVAFGLGVVIPGGGEFYLRNWSGGIQAVVTDLILFEALRRSESSARGVAFFLGSVHVVEGLFAAQRCRSKEREKPGAPPLPPSETTAEFRRPMSGPERREAALRNWREARYVGVQITLPLER